MKDEQDFRGTFDAQPAPILECRMEADDMSAKTYLCREISLTLFEVIFPNLAQRGGVGFQLRGNFIAQCGEGGARA
jgi:hypothetical protein